MESVTVWMGIMIDILVTRLNQYNVRAVMRHALLEHKLGEILVYHAVTTHLLCW